MSILILSNKQWGYNVYKKLKKNYPNIKYTFCDDHTNLLKKLDVYHPTKVFVLHWDRLINDDLLKKSNFIGFHSSDLPKFRGGSPIQNQIIRGYKSTMLTCFLLDKKLDNGDYLFKKRLCLKGSLKKIFKQLEMITYEMISKLSIKKNIRIKNYNNNRKEGTVYRRLTKMDLNLKKYKNIEKIYDVIRMVDHPEYDSAYLELRRNIHLKFSNAKLNKNSLTCKIKIEKIKLNENSIFNC